METTDAILRIALPVFFAFYFGIAFIAKSYLVARRIGKNPMVFPVDESAHSLIGYYFKILMAVLFIYVIIYGLKPNYYDYFLPIHQLEYPIIRYIGLALLIVSFIWTIIAQFHMQDSWRIGIDQHDPTELVTSGLFKVSRNPIFLGMVNSLIGLFLTTPNALTAIFLTLGYVLIQTQIRLEEAHLLKQHGQDYIDYQKKVNRFL